MAFTPCSPRRPSLERPAQNRLGGPIISALARTSRSVSASRLALVAAVASLIFGWALAGDAEAAGSAYTLKWAAADPAVNFGPYQPTYDKETPAERSCPAPSGGTGRSSDPSQDAVTNSPTGANDSVSSLAPKDMAIGQIVPFQLEVTVGAGANGNLQFNPFFRTKTTSGADFGFDPAYGLYCAFVDTGDQGTVDPGANAKVSSFSSVTNDPGASTEQIYGTINVGGLNPGDKVIVEIWVVLKDQIPGGANGNVQTGLDAAREPSSGQSVNVGNQTVPLLRVQEFFSSEADVSVTKTDSPDPILRGQTLTYTLSVKNNSADTIANGVVVTDNLDPNSIFISASGATCSAAGSVVTCNVGFLQQNETKQITITTVVSSTAPISNNASSGAHAGYQGTTCPSAPATDLCNRVRVASTVTGDPTAANNSYVQPTNVVTGQPAISQQKTVTDLNGGEALPGDVLLYSITTTNSSAPGTDAAVGVIVRDPIPNDTTYQAGSITTASTSRTDASGDDVAEFESGMNRVVARVGSGATATAGGRLAPGESATVTFRVTVGTPLPDDRQVKNTATASFFAESDGAPGTATSNAQITVGAPDLTIEKRRTSGAVVAGQDITYEIAVENVGDAKSAGTVTVSDALPAGLTIETVSGTGWTCTITPPTPSREFSCTRSSTLAPGSSYPVISVRADTDPGLTGAVTNTAVVSGGSDINYDNNSSTDTTSAGHSADLVVNKAAAPGTIRVGETSNFTIVVRNDGPSKATAVGLDDPIPAGLEQVGNATTTRGSCVAGLVVCDLGDLAPGESATVTVVVRATSAGSGMTITNVATAQSTGAPDPTPGNNSDDADVVVRGVDLALDKSIEPDAPFAGGPITFVLVVANNGPSDATGVVVHDTIPNTVTGATVADDGGADCAIAAGELVCDVGDLGAGESLTIEVSGTVASGATVVTNTAAVSGAEIDENPSNNTDTAQKTTARRADLSIQKSASQTEVQEGDEFNYKFVVRNDGPNPAENAEVADPLPAGVDFVAASSGCSESAGGVVCELGDMQPGETRTVTVRVSVNGGASGTLGNTGRVDSDTDDPDPSDNESSASVIVVQPPDPQTPDAHADLSLKKTADKADASPGEQVTYTFTATNRGADTAHQVKVRDPLSPYLQFVSGASGCAYANSEVVCDFGTLAPGQSASKSIVLRLDPNYGSASVPTAHLIEVIKVEDFLSVQAGEYRQASLTCPSGYAMTDGTPRVDSVDQGNDPADVHFIRSQTPSGNAPADIAGYRFEIENHTSGQAQVRLFGVCVALSASGNGGHSLGTPGVRLGSIDATDLTAPTLLTKTLTCPNPNEVAIAPGYTFRTGSAYVHGPHLLSEPSPDGRSWTFGFQVAPNTPSQNDARVDLAIRCLPRTTSANDGHEHALTFQHVYGRVAVGPHSTGEYRLSCPVGFKGITASHDLPTGLKLLGTTPEPINRDFRILNTTGSTLYANIDLLCMATRIGDELNGGDVMNTASIYGDEPDWNAGNNFSSWVLHDPPLAGGSGSSGGGPSGGDSTGSPAAGGEGGGSSSPAPEPRPDDSPAAPEKLELRLGRSITPSGKTAMVPLYGGQEPTSGTIGLSRQGRQLGSARFELEAGEDAYVDVRLSKKGRKILSKLRSATVTIEAGEGSVEQVLRVAR